MARQNVVYGLTNALQVENPLNIIAQRAPTSRDRNYEVGQIWIDQPNQTVYQLTAVIAGVPTWSTAPASGATVVTSLTVTAGDIHITATPGNIIVDQGDLTLTNGNTVLQGNLTVTGNTIVNGDFDLTDAASIGLTSTNNAAGAITLTANGGVLESILLRSLQGTAATSLNLVSTAGGATINAGLGTANAINLTAITAGGGLTGTLGSGGFLVTAANGPITMNSGTGTVSIGTDATNAIMNIGTGGGVKQVTIGSLSGASFTDINAGTAGILITSAVTGQIFLGSAAMTAPLTLGASTAGQTISIGNAINVGAQVVNIAAGASGANSTVNILSGNATAGTQTLNLISGTQAGAINIGTGAAAANVITVGGTGANLITIGDTQIAGSVAIGTAMTTGTISIGGTGLQTGTVSIAPGTGAQIVNIGTGGTGVKTIHIGDGAIGNIITIGSLTAAASLTLQSGTGGLNLSTAATGAMTINASSTALVVNRAVNVAAAAGVDAFTSTALTTGIAGTFTSSAATVDAIRTAGGGIRVAVVSSAAGASPRTVSARHGQAIFTDVIANGAYGTLTITNTIVTATSLILANASCTTVNSAISIVEITPGAGSFAVRIFNAGAASTAANILVNFWCMSA